MAEVKNTFIQSKMNQDLDGRILPNGQYRYGKNIQISRSEGEDVGALENVLGTELLTTFGLTNTAYEIIGHIVDVSSDLVYVFITDYSDSSNNNLANNITGQNNAFNYDNKNCFIGVYNDRTNVSKLLVGGDFLNFSKTHPITGANLVEDLLFWTDNRNQPRKININTANGTPFVLGGAAGYYTNEDHISVAKYYPFECISLLKAVEGSAQFDSSMTNKTESLLPSYCIGEVVSTPAMQIEIRGEYNNIELGSTIIGVNVGNNILSGDRPTVSGSTIGGGNTTLDVTESQTTLAPGDLVYFHLDNPEYDPAWPGDETFLSDKFVRFSYRFEFDDGEYSLMAPFTQACFVPKQDGYFVGGDVENIEPPDNTSPAIVPAPEINWPVSSTLIGDEGSAYASSIVEFFENKVQDIGLYIPAPYKNSTQSTFDTIQDEFKIKNIEIIYKESNNNNACVLDTIAADSGTNPFNLETSSFYSYDYQSRKPWKTLPEREITRVYDKVPIRALAQESSGNRIIYGNYVDKHTSPNSLTYVVGIDPKPSLPTGPSDFPKYGNREYYVRKEYQNHTVKQNRTYQVGVVLSDRYGRQSDVILSDIFNTVIQGRGSTIYHPYRTTQNTLIDIVDTWPGDMINMIWHQIIPEDSSNGYPGTYRNNDGTFIGFAPGGTSANWSSGLPAGDTCEFPDVDIVGMSGSTATIGFFVDSNGEIIYDTVVVSSSSTDWQEGELIATMTPTGFPFCYNPIPGHTQSLRAETLIDQNTLGWYSWKVVVKQTEQDYYNCYLPGVLAGYPKDIRENTPVSSPNTASIIFAKGDESRIGHIVLLNDNINKIPRDLSEVGPEQKTFGSSVKLFGRVENFKTPVDYYTYNRQFNPETFPDTVVNIGTITDLNLGKKDQAGSFNTATAPLSYPSSTSLLIPINFYNGKANPLVAEISTKREIGWSANDTGVAGSIDLGMIPYLAIYETEPVVSDLDIYWETSTGGLIADLNHNIKTLDNTVPCGITDPSIDWTEGDAPGDIISAKFKAVSCTGVELDSPAQETEVTLVSVMNDLGHEKVHEFIMLKAGPSPLFNEYQIQIGTNPYEGYFLAWNDESRRTWTFTFQVDRPATLLTQAYSAQFTRTVQVQNDTPNQIGMFDTGGGNNARTDLKLETYPEVGYLGSLWSTGPTPGVGGCGGTLNNPPSSIVGDWQLDLPLYAGQLTNPYWETFGLNFNPSSLFTGDNTGYGANNDGTQYYAPTFNTTVCQNRSWVGHTIDISRFLDRKITMVNAPGNIGTAWTGEFKAFNGAYGSIPGYVAPSNPNKGSELVYSIARAYQVSAFFPIQTDFVSQYAQYSIGEAVFANESMGGSPLGPVPSLLPLLPGINANWKGWISGTINPTGPIYRDFAQGNILDPADINTGGEATVGQLYNIPETTHIHYWEGLADCAPTYPTMLQLQTPGPGVSEMPNSPSKAGFWYVNAVDATGSVAFGLDLKLGLAQACGIDNYHVPNFVIKQSSPPNAYDPQEAYLYTDPFVPMPPGRYVVTVRATDRSISGPSGDGLYFEWDVPIIINGPFIEHTGSFWVKCTTPYVNLESKFEADRVSTYPWRDIPL